NLPCQLAVEILAEIPVSAVTAFTGVLAGHAVLGRRSDRRIILAADRTVNAHRIVSLSLLRRRLLLTELIKDIKDLFSLLDRLDHIFCIFAASVILTLSPEVHLDAETCQRLLKLFLKMLRIRTAAAIRVLHIHIRFTDIF